MIFIMRENIFDQTHLRKLCIYSVIENMRIIEIKAKFKYLFLRELIGKEYLILFQYYKIIIFI